MVRSILRLPIGFVALCCAATIVATAQPPDRSPPFEIAKVDGQAILSDEAELLLEQSLRGRKANDDAMPFLKAQALEQAIGQRLIVNYLRRTEQAVSVERIAEATAELKAQAEREKRDWATFLKYRGYTPAALAQQLQWRIGWRAWLDKHLTETALKEHFAKHAALYDGRQLRVRHVLWQLPAPATMADAQAKLTAARQVREQLVAKEIDFAQAAKKHSSGPSRVTGGELGWIERHAPMDEAFSAAAFQLSAGELSQPVRGPFGIHLIECLEIKPGKLTAADVRDELRGDLTRIRFEEIVAEERPRAKIEDADAWPHFRPGTRELER